METLGALVGRDRRSDLTAIRTDPADRAMSYRDFCTTAWKAGNFLRYLGVRAGDRVAVAADQRPEPVLALFGAALLGASVRFFPGSPPTETAAQSRVVVGPADLERTLEVPPEARLLVYGGPPERSRTAHWEGDVWSENPAFPPTTVDPEATVLTTAAESFSHERLLAAAEELARTHDLERGSTVCVRESLASPGAIVAGVLAPLLVEATVVFPDGESTCDVGVGQDYEPLAIDPASALD
jgi:acyl-CoA synthetase (AMP-forming)/AMP-acid ligase II